MAEVWSDCMTPPEGTLDDRGLFLCGCGQHHAWIPEARIINWDDQHWYLVCAFRQSLVIAQVGI